MFYHCEEPPHKFLLTFGMCSDDVISNTLCILEVSIIFYCSPTDIVSMMEKNHILKIASSCAQAHYTTCSFII